MQPMLEDYKDFYEVVLETKRRYEASPSYEPVEINWSLADSPGYIPWRNPSIGDAEIKVGLEIVNLFINDYSKIPFGEGYIDVVEFTYKNNGSQEFLYGAAGGVIDDFKLSVYLEDEFTSFSEIQPRLSKGSYTGVEFIHSIAITPGSSLWPEWYVWRDTLDGQNIDSGELQEFVRGINNRAGIFPVKGILPIIVFYSGPQL